MLIAIIGESGGEVLQFLGDDGASLVALGEAGRCGGGGDGIVGGRGVIGASSSSITDG